MGSGMVKLLRRDSENQAKITQCCIICDPVQQKGHLVGQVYSEIMNKTVCKEYKEIKRKFTFCKTFAKVSLHFL